MTLNGLHALRPNVISLGDLSPEDRVVEVVRDGATVALRAYVNGERTYLGRAVAFSAARRSWIDATTLKDDDGAPVLDPETGRPMRIDDSDGIQWSVFLASALMAITTDERGDEPGLLQDEALVLAFNGGGGTNLLEETGWLPKQREATPDPEALGGEKPTGESSSPISATTTPGAGPI